MTTDGTFTERVFVDQLCVSMTVHYDHELNSK